MALFNWGHMRDCTVDSPKNDWTVTAHQCEADCGALRNCAHKTGLHQDMETSDECYPFHAASGDHEVKGLASGGLWINHFEFQSLEHWEAKKARGRTNDHSPRLGTPPWYFNDVEDASGAIAIQLRIRAVQSAPLRTCLARKFLSAPGSAAAEDSPSAMNSPSTCTPPAPATRTARVCGHAYGGTIDCAIASRLAAS